MSDPLFSRLPPCLGCGAPIRLRERQLEGWHDYECTSCEWWEAYRKPLTLATAPWTAPVVAAVLEVVDRHIDGAPEWDASPSTLALRSLREDLAGKKS